MGYLAVVFAALPVLLFYLIYRDFFLFHHAWAIQIDALFRGVLAAALLLLLTAVIPPIVSTVGMTAFLQAALPEKLAMFVCILFWRGKNSLSVDVAFGAIAGLAFAFCENLLYGISQRDPIVIARLLSAVPIHLVTCGLMGFYLWMAENRIGFQRVASCIIAFALPFLLHALFDFFTLAGKPWVASTAILFPSLVLFDMHLAYARSIPSPAIVASMGLRFPQWMILKRQSQFERWILRSISSERAEYPPVFKLKLGPRRIILASVFAAIPLFQDTVIFRSIPPSERTAFLVTLPLLLLAALIASGIFNPGFFRAGMLRIPFVMQAWIEGSSEHATTYDLFHAGFFLKTTTPHNVGEEVTVNFSRGRLVSPSVRARAIWDNHKNLRMEFGTVFEFDQEANREIRYFLFRLWMMRIGQGIAYFFKTPGHSVIRRLFVQPESVMSDLRYFSKGSVLIRQGEPGDEFFMIRQGTVRVTKHVGNVEQELALLGPGEILGEMAIAGSLPRNATATCQTDSILTVADGRDLEDLVRNNPDFARALLHLMARRFFESSETLEAGLEAARADEHLTENLMRAWVVLLASREADGKVRVQLEKLSQSLGIDATLIERILRTKPREIHSIDGEVLNAIWQLSRKKLKLQIQ
ncbi:MAG: cyclic nucleotide-binding domain-containing protein [Leptospirales bacterium]|nr:cyclic nucleotide-binding domain-containing protein [Leptospirales bacterium]